MESIGTDIFYSYNLNDSSYCPVVKEMESLFNSMCWDKAVEKN